MSVEVGDAVLRFIGDSTQLDTKFDEVKPNAEKAFDGAAEAVEEGTGRMKNSMGEARGEAALLGEAFGVHLPRHVRSFIAELPGVGQALSAAFSATAILFVASALIDLSKKLSEALAQFLYAKDVWDETTKSVVDLNNELIGLEKEYARLKKEADDYGKSALQLAQMHKGEVKESITELNKTLKEEEDHFKALQRDIDAHQKTVLSTSAAWDAWRSGNLGALQALKAWTVGIDTSIVKHKELDEVENKVLLTNQKLKNAHQELRVATNGVSKAQDELNAKGAALQLQIEKTADEINKLNQRFNTFKVDAASVEIVTPAQVQNMLNGVAAARNYGIVLRQDLWQALKDAKKAQDDFMKSGLQDGVAQRQFAENIIKARQALDSYGKSVDMFKVKSHGMWSEFRADVKAGATSIDQAKQIGVTAFDAMSKGLEGAIQTAILAQGSFTQALEKATASALASVASQAIVKALFYTAEGFAALAGFEDTSAGQYFAAAGEMAAVGAAAGLAGRALSGAASSGSGGGSTQQGHDSTSNTGSSNRSGGSTVAVQHFATGGLISDPVLAMVGEAHRKEAVLPLEDPRAMKEIGKAIGEHGGNTHHWHIEGLVSPDNLGKVVKQISKMVDKGQVHLKASDSLRVTKRSA